MKKLAIVIATVAALVNPAFAGTWCATVNTDVAEGHLDVHGGPSDTSPVLRQLQPGEYIELNDNPCGHELDAERTILGTICAPAGSEYDPVEYIKSADIGAFLAPQNHKGWVNRLPLTRVDCIDHGPAVKPGLQPQ